MATAEPPIESPTETDKRAAAELGITPEEMVRILDVWSKHARDVALERRKARVANVQRIVVE
ncbi:hypothetical protein SEA_BILLNYE_110 [Streptomyces phage BillNye]|uniref:Uncharacterized protein n=1 Tax=Streptomyces phage BillNye TaxID=2079426 RepID=A0A2L1IVV4_9CAUD|nr:hypothetical protein FDJ30_gp135 [Streptomyces phage BillNye]AVD99298.1 hypothetical protein SEA_BILLNYE_110 [Streptomyces phage BillNye]